jgi:hypothetical protein
MIDIENAILYIEPKEEKIHTPEKLIEYDWLKYLYGNALYGTSSYVGSFFLFSRYLGVHRCKCGAVSESCDYLFSNNMYTNSLCMHYLEWHFHEIPESEFKKLDQLKRGVEFRPCYKCKRYSSTVRGKYKRCEKCRKRKDKSTTISVSDN